MPETITALNIPECQRTAVIDSSCACQDTRNDVECKAKSMTPVETLTLLAKALAGHLTTETGKVWHVRPLLDNGDKLLALFRWSFRCDGNEYHTITDTDFEGLTKHGSLLDFIETQAQEAITGIALMEQQAAEHSRIGFVAGAFDLLHPGHILMLQDAAAQCDKLVVALHVDPSVERPEKNKPILEWWERETILDALACIHVVRLYKTEAGLISLLERIEPDVRILGSDWRGKPYTGEHLSIPIYWHERDHDWSSSALRLRVYEIHKPISFGQALIETQKERERRMVSDKVVLSGNLRYIHSAERGTRQLELNDIPLFNQLDQLCVSEDGGWWQMRREYGNVGITIERLKESE